MLKLPNWLILVGTNRNAGKTSLACQIVEKYKSQGITAIKVSPHFHELDRDDDIISQTSNFVIVKEQKKGTGKDSSRMLDAGADEVFYVQVWDQNLEAAFTELMKHINPHNAVVCESGWMRNLVEPAVFFILKRKNGSDTKESITKMGKLANGLITFDGNNFDNNLETLRLEENCWSYSN
jgi:hypothetical protein